MTSILFVSEYANTIRIADGQEPYAQYSHALNGFYMAHEAARMGWDVYFKAFDESHCYKFEQTYPVLKLGKPENFTDPAFQPDIIMGIFPQYLLNHRSQKPNAIGVMMLPAHSWLESTGNLGFDYIECLRLTLAHDIDYIVTQNPRMKDFMLHLAGMTTRWHWEDRILCAPIGYVPEQLAQSTLAHAKKFDRAAMRRRMGLKDDDIAIINAGGPWDWTDIEAFVNGFILAVRAGARHLKFFQMGIRQKMNTDNEQSFQFFQRIMRDNYDLIGRNLIIIEEWERASDCLPFYNYGADLGLNVNKDSPENYQSHRLRFIDYIKAGLPVLNTEGDYLLAYGAKNAAVTVPPGDADAYRDLLLSLDKGQYDLAALRAATVAFRKTISSREVYPPILQHLADGMRIPAAERRPMIENCVEIYKNFRFPA